jgi:manganese/zinc/iron transport system substrate-binding protein
MDPVIWGRTAQPVAELLAGVMPKHADEFRENARKYVAAANELADECARALSTIPRANRTLISAHDAFEYYGRRFELDVRGIQGLSTESEASIADIEQLVAEISERRVPTAFIETTVSDRTVRALVEGCASIGHELRIGEALFSDSLGRPSTPEGTWVGMIRHNTRVIVTSLGGNP